jgi:hypothetical protein
MDIIVVVIIIGKKRGIKERKYTCISTLTTQSKG